MNENKTEDEPKPDKPTRRYREYEVVLHVRLIDDPRHQIDPAGIGWDDEWPANLGEFARTIRVTELLQEEDERVLEGFRRLHEALNAHKEKP